MGGTLSTELHAPAMIIRNAIMRVGTQQCHCAERHPDAGMLLVMEPVPGEYVSTGVGRTWQRRLDNVRALNSARETAMGRWWMLSGTGSRWLRGCTVTCRSIRYGW